MKTSVQCTPAAKRKMLHAFCFSRSLTQERMTGAGLGWWKSAWDVLSLALVRQRIWD